MKNLKWYHWIGIAVGIFILVLIFNEKARANFFYWVCRHKNKWHKVKNDKCTNCVPPGSKEATFEGIINDNGECVPDPVKIYEGCLSDNASKHDGAECDNCVPPAGMTASVSNSTVLDGYVTQFKGVIVDGKCMPLPDAFAGKICVPNGAPVTPSALSYKRVLQMGAEATTSTVPNYKYYMSDGNKVRQGQATLLDTEITHDDYIQAYVQTIKPCPEGQTKV